MNLGANCVKQQNFGFDDGQPCILLKLNKVVFVVTGKIQSVCGVVDKNGCGMIVKVSQLNCFLVMPDCGCQSIFLNH